MKYQQYEDVIVFRIDPGEDLVEQVSAICQTLNITSGTITGIGATNQVTIGVYEVGTKQYHSKTITGDHEIINLSGNITSMDDLPYLHLHITLANAQNEAIGGHLTKAVISATFEGMITKINGTVKRRHDSSIGLNLLDL